MSKTALVSDNKQRLRTSLNWKSDEKWHKRQPCLSLKGAQHTQSNDCPAGCRVKITALAWPKLLGSVSSQAHHSPTLSQACCLRDTSCYLLKRCIQTFYYFVSTKPSSLLISIHMKLLLCSLNIKSTSEKICKSSVLL